MASWHMQTGLTVFASVDVKTDMRFFSLSNASVRKTIYLRRELQTIDLLCKNNATITLGKPVSIDLTVDKHLIGICHNVFRFQPC